DRFSRQIYASIPGTTPLGNSIVSINPFTGTLGVPIFIGSEPGKLAVSDNGQYLYVSLDGAAAVRRLDLASGTPGLQFSLGSSPLNDGLYYVDDVKVLPGNPSAVAVSRKSTITSSYGTVAIYDDGIKRPA